MACAFFPQTKTAQHARYFQKTSAALPVLVVAISVAVMGLGYLGSRYFIPVSLSALLFFTFPFVSQHNNAGEVFFTNPAQ